MPICLYSFEEANLIMLFSLSLKIPSLLIKCTFDCFFGRYKDFNIKSAIKNVTLNDENKTTNFMKLFFIKDKTR